MLTSIEFPNSSIRGTGGGGAELLSPEIIRRCLTDGEFQLSIYTYLELSSQASCFQHPATATVMP